MSDRCPHCGHMEEGTPLGSLLTYVRGMRLRAANWVTHYKNPKNQNRYHPNELHRAQRNHKRWETWASELEALMKDRAN